MKKIKHVHGKLKLCCVSHHDKFARYCPAKSVIRIEF